MGKVEGNPEFAKWWRRWVSRVQRMSIRRNLPARHARLERPDEVSPDPVEPSRI